MRPGDIVTQLDGLGIRSPRDFYEILETVTPGQELELGVWRKSRAILIRVSAEQIPDSVIPELSQELLGMILEPMERGGFRVVGVRPNSDAARLEIRRSDVLVAVSGRPLRGGDDLRRALLALRGRNRALVVVQRGAGRYHLSLRLA